MAIVHSNLSQHCWPRMCKRLPNQTIAIFRRNISQHCWTQHDHPVATCWVWLAQIWAKCCDMLGVGGSNLTTPTMTQQVATGWSNARNMLRPTILRYVALKGCDRMVESCLVHFLSAPPHSTHWTTSRVEKGEGEWKIIFKETFLFRSSKRVLHFQTEIITLEMNQTR